MPYTIAFGNGVGNTKDEADNSVDILAGVIGTKFNNVDVNYTVAYNPTNGPGAGTLLDVVDVIKQKSEENNSLWSLSWKVIFGVVSKTEPNQSWVSTIAQVWKDYDTNDQDPQRVLRVAHSQGNLYGNIALQKLRNEMDWGQAHRFGMVGVGSAADFVFDDGTYLTSTNDNVINALRFFYTGVLLPNMTLPAVPEVETTNVNDEPVVVTDYTGHGFATAYRTL